MNAYFADTFYFVALLNPGDEAHPQAREFAIHPLGPIVTTAWVLTEVADAFCAPSNRPLFLGLMKLLRSKEAVEVIPPDSSLFNRGIDLYSRRTDKAWSLTDCISFVVMEDRGLSNALTGDHHFEQAGFQALLKV